MPYPSARALHADSLSLNPDPAARQTPAGGADGGRPALAQARAEDPSPDQNLSLRVAAGAAAAAAEVPEPRLPALAAAAPRVPVGPGADARTLSSGVGVASDRRMSPLASAVLSLVQVRAAAVVQS